MYSYFVVWFFGWWSFPMRHFTCFLTNYWTSHKHIFWHLADNICIWWFHLSSISWLFTIIKNTIICRLSDLHHHVWVWYTDHNKEYQNPMWLSQLLSDSGHQIASFIAKSGGLSWYEVIPLDELPVHDSQAEAGVKLLKEVRRKLLHSPEVREVKQVGDMAQLFASEMKLPKPSFAKKKLICRL